MGAITRHDRAPLRGADWQPDVTQLMDEQHLAAWSDDPRTRVTFATRLSHFLETQRDTEVVNFYGRFVTDLEAFCYQLESALPGSPLARRIHGPTGVISLLRERETFRFRAPPKFRYYVWHDADVLIERDRMLFGQLVDAVLGVSAENEFISDDALMIQRAVFLGGPALKAYADDANGQMRSWLPDGHPEPFWRAVTGVDRPHVAVWEISRLV
ncbi:MAG: hypothetical protein AAGB51_13400 [Planctomycetota bacterium]